VKDCVGVRGRGSGRGHWRELGEWEKRRRMVSRRGRRG